MAGKRGATSDLNHENWDREEDSEDAGTFKKASDDVLKRRVIRTARRRNIGALATAESPGNEEKKSIFGGFTAFTKTPANPSVAFGFLNNADNKSPDRNGTNKSKENKTDAKSDEYYAKLKGLNESVSNWIKKHVDDNPLINLKPIFRDYEKYFLEIESSKVVSAETKKELSTFSFKAPNKPEENKPEKVTEKAPPFSFGKSNVDDKKEAPKFSFGAPASTPLTFGTPSSANSFSFVGPTSTPYTFANVAKPPAPPEKTEEEEDEPPKVEFTPVVEDGHVYTTRCKVFVKKDGNFGDRGVGNLFLKPVPDTQKVQLIVRADTNLGNLLCNFILSEGIPTQRMGKKDVMLVCIPTPDSKPPPVSILLRVKSPEDADELLKTLEKHKK